MANITTITYDLTGGSGGTSINPIELPTDVTKLSFQVSGSAAVNGTATCKLQESNVFAQGKEDIVGATAIANVSSEEYTGQFNVGGAYLYYDIALGTATAGIVTLTIKYG